MIFFAGFAIQMYGSEIRDFFLIAMSYLLNHSPLT